MIDYASLKRDTEFHKKYIKSILKVINKEIGSPG